MGIPGWIPPTETERRLCEAGARGDWEGQVAAVAGEDLYLVVPQQGQDPLPVYEDPAGGGTCIPVTTRGMLPPWHPQQLFDRVSVEELAQDWPNDRWKLAVNPGTPCAAYLPATAAHRGTWTRIRAQYGVRPGGLLTTHLGGPLHGPLAQGLACGAPIAVHHSVPWNELGTAFLDYAADAQLLHEQWSVTDPASWQQRLGQLLDAGFVPAGTEAALRARDAGDDAGSGGVPELVEQYEERFRTEGLLPADGRVKSIVALDYAHAVALVRWGLGARYCAPPEAEQAVLRAGELARAAYGSWQEFSAGYALGRALAFDNGWFGTAYQETVHLHRVLGQDPASPWANLPFA